MNGFLGRRLPALLLDAGLELIGGDVHTSMARPGGASFEFHRLTVEGSAPMLIAAGLMSEADVPRVLGVLGSPSTVITSVAVVGAWGRRPS